MGAVFKREFRAYFTSPLGYVFCGAFLLFANLMFCLINVMSSVSDLSNVFGWMLMVLTFTTFILTMRLFADEFKQKTDQLLLTAPVKLTSLVMGKFFSALSVFLLVLVFTLIWPLIISIYGVPNMAAIVGNYFALIAIAGVYISIGMFISSLTENQFIAAIGALGVSLLYIVMDQVAAIVPIDWLAAVLKWLSVFGRYDNLAKGLFSVTDIVFYFSTCAIFLFLTVRMLEKKRWA